MTTQFHRTWFGPKPMPQHCEDYWRAWQRQFPQARFTTWGHADIARLTRTRHKIAEATSWAGKSDIARYEILHTHGGIHLDCEMRPHQWFDAAGFGDDLVVCNEDASTDYCSQGFFAAPAGHPVFLDLMRAIDATDLASDLPHQTTGPWAFGKALRAHPHRRLATATFYPYLYNEAPSVLLGRDLRQTWGIPVWGGSRLEPVEQQKNAAMRLQQGDLHAAMRLLGPDDSPLLRTARLASQARHQVLQAVREPPFRTALQKTDFPKFAFLHVLFWLLRQNPDRMVWQVGAADGILADPLRPALVNFDPPALLLEPNPHLHRRLVRHCAGNPRARCVQAAFGAAPGSMVLNAIHPDKLADLGLPDWVLGLSSAYTDRNALGGKAVDAETRARIQACVERIDVPVLAMPELLALADGRPPEVLVVDAEGMDRIVIDSVLGGGQLPLLIHFAVQCLPPEDSQPLLARLARDYVVLDFGADMTAYRKDLLMGYARHLYMDHGHATMFAQGIRAVCAV